MYVGILLGSEEGVVEGSLVGLPVETTEGSEVRPTVGPVGSEVGSVSVGMTVVGFLVGFLDGLDEDGR